MFVYFIIISSRSQQFPTSSSQNQVELGEWATGHFMHCDDVTEPIMTSQRLAARCIIFQPFIWTIEHQARTWKESPNIAKWRQKQGVNRQYTGDFDAISFITRCWINLYCIVAFYGPGAVLGILNRGSGLRPSGFTWQVTSAHLAGDVIQVWINSSPSNHGISHFKAQLAQLFSILCVRTG